MLRDWLSPRPLFVAVTLLATCASARSEDKGYGEGEASHAKPKYKAEVDVGGKEVPKDFDLSKSEDEAALLEAIRHGHVEELKKDEPPSLKKLFSLSADLGLWSLVVFGLLLFVLSKLAWPKMIEGLRKREERIHSAAEDARRATEEAQTMHARLQKNLAEANLQAAKIIDDGRKAGQAVAEDIASKARTEIQAERERLHREIEMQTNQAIQRIWSQAADLATLVASKALGGAITENGHRQLIERALADIRASGGGANGHA